MRRLFDIALCVGIGLAASAADLSFAADAWKVDYVASGSVLTLTHPASGTVIEGELSFDGDATLGATTNRLVLTDDKGRIVGGVAFPRSGDRIGLLLFSDAVSGQLFFDGSIRYRADAFACQTAPGDSRLLSLVAGDADNLHNDALFSPSHDEALVVQGVAASLAVAGAGRHGIEFGLDAGAADTAQIHFTIERNYYRTRWCPNYRPGAPLPAREWLARHTPPAPDRQTAEGRRFAETMRAFVGFPGVRPTVLCPQEGPVPIWDLAVKRAFGQMHFVALFNWSDTPAEIEVAWDDLGEDGEHEFAVYEIWGEAWLGVLCEKLSVQVPTHGVRLFAVQPHLGHPQFLASGDWTALAPVVSQEWANDELKVEVAVSGGRPHTVRFAVPDSFTFDSVRVPEGVTVQARCESGGRVLAVTLTVPKDGKVPAALKFK